MNHSELIKSLAKQFDSYDWLIFTESCVLGHGSPIPDLMLIKKSYSRPEIRIYEVKASNADFQQDFRKSKFETYLPYAHKLYFAIGPDVTIDVKKILDGHPVGIIKYSKSKDCWSNVKPAPKNINTSGIGNDFFLSLMMNGKRFGIKPTRLDRLEEKFKVLVKGELKEKIQEFRHSIGNEFYQKLKELEEKERQLSRKENQLENDINDQKTAVIKKLKEDLGLKGWGYDIDAEYVFEEVVLRELRETFNKQMKNIKENFISGVHI